MADDPNAASRSTTGHPAGSRRPRARPVSDDWTAEDVLADVGSTANGAIGQGSGRTIPDPSTWLPALPGWSLTPGVCPFLRSVGADDAIAFPVESPDVTNRCAALREAVPQSLRQQELVCLTAGHVNCPRYLRGALVASESPSWRIRVGPVLTPAITVALAVLVLSFGVSVAFVVANGGLTLPVAATAATASPSGTAVAVGPSSEPGAGATPVASVVASPVPTSSRPGPTPAPAPTPTGAATPEPTPVPTRTPKPRPTSDRYAVLTACPDKPNCWIYVVRSGDNLFSIANYFGVSLERVKALNPWTRTQSLRAGRELILPTPTR